MILELEIQPDENIDENQCGNEDMTFVLQDIDVTASDNRRIALNVMQEKENLWIPWPLISLKSKTKELQAFLPEQKQLNLYPECHIRILAEQSKKCQ